MWMRHYTGWGAHLLDQQVAGRWSPADRACHINVLELRAVILVIKKWELIPKRHLQLIGAVFDSQTFCAEGAV